jgi:hypothetical protein
VLFSFLNEPSITRINGKGSRLALEKLIRVWRQEYSHKILMKIKLQYLNLQTFYVRRNTSIIWYQTQFKNEWSSHFTWHSGFVYSLHLLLCRHWPLLKYSRCFTLSLFVVTRSWPFLVAFGFAIISMLLFITLFEYHNIKT